MRGLLLNEVSQSVLPVASGLQVARTQGLGRSRYLLKLLPSHTRKRLALVVTHSRYSHSSRRALKSLQRPCTAVIANRRARERSPSARARHSCSRQRARIKTRQQK